MLNDKECLIVYGQAMPFTFSQGDDVHKECLIVDG